MRFIISQKVCGKLFIVTNSDNTTILTCLVISIEWDAN